MNYTYIYSICFVYQYLGEGNLLTFTQFTNLLNNSQGTAFTSATDRQGERKAATLPPPRDVWLVVSTNPSEKYAMSKMGSPYPKFPWWFFLMVFKPPPYNKLTHLITKMCSNHHLDVIHQVQNQWKYTQPNGLKEWNLQKSCLPKGISFCSTWFSDFHVGKLQGLQTW